MAYVDFTMKLHKGTKRDYLQRVIQHDKAESGAVAKQYGKDYWDGDRKYGYGGYRYDGRWGLVAEDMARYYDLKRADRILDVGCGKGFLLYEFAHLIPGVEVVGIDISQYAIRSAKQEVKPFLQVGNAIDLPYECNSFDFVVSLGTLHNLYVYDLWRALQEIERVSKGKKYITIESYRTEQEKVNLLYWQLTCESFYTPQEWEWIFKKTGYTGDYGCIFFE